MAVQMHCHQDLLVIRIVNIIVVEEEEVEVVMVIVIVIAMVMVLIIALEVEALAMIQTGEETKKEEVHSEVVHTMTVALIDHLVLTVLLLLPLIHTLTYSFIRRRSKKKR